MIIDDKGSFITQRQLPKMALIKPVIHSSYLTLTAESMADIQVPLEPPSDKRNCRFIFLGYFKNIKLFNIS